MKLFKGKVSLVLVVFSLLVLCASLSVAREDPELRQCKHQCREQRQFGSEQRQHCESACEEYIKEKHGGEEEREGMDMTRRHDPDREYRQCRERCQEREEGRRQQQVCESQCEEKRIEQEREERRRGDDMVERRGKRSEEEEEEEEFGGKSGRPYVFQDQHFSTEYKDQEGRVRVLERFNERSRLFKGIENYRIMIFESNPQTFVVPNHWDADVLFFVAQGKGTVSLVYSDRRESFNIEQGHVMVIPAGVTAYLINRGNNDKLVIVKLINPVSTPGSFEQFFGPGGENPESFFCAFSNDILEAAFKTSRENLKKVFSQSEGAIIRASEEQIRALTHEKSGHWPFGGKGSKDSAPYHLLKRQPIESNAFGTLFELKPEHYSQLEDLNVAVSFGNITQGSMHTPFYNSRATKIAVVVKGKGYFEMACPHVSESGHKQHHRHESSRRGDKSTVPIHYEKISSEVRQGTVFVVPPGHPFVTVASEDENLEIICFEVNAENNRKVPLAGQRNIYKNLEKEAKKLAFAASAEEVDEVLASQEEEFFFRGPRQQKRHRGYSII
ncbi:Vicilin-like antimicrobial peptides 2-1 [Bienertia sinuspersici]